MYFQFIAAIEQISVLIIYSEYYQYRGAGPFQSFVL